MNINENVKEVIVNAIVNENVLVAGLEAGALPQDAVQPLHCRS